jgi:hypothetical protein
LLLRLLGDAVACIGGGVTGVLDSLEITFPLPLAVYILGLVFWGLVAAVLLRRSGATLIVPIAFSAALQLTSAYQVLGLDLHHWLDFRGVDVQALVFVSLLLGFPLAMGATFGTLIGYRIEERLRR